MNFSAPGSARKWLVLPVLVFMLVMSVPDTAAQAVPDSDTKFLSGPEFVLSADAVRASIDGKLQVYVEVDKTGSVKTARIMSGPAWPCDSTPKEELKRVRDAVKNNILASKFSPSIKNGKPRDSELTLDFMIGEAYKRASEKKDLEEALRSGAKSPLVRSGRLNGRALALPKPPYPPRATAERLSGDASVEIVIATDGRVVSAGNTDGHPVFFEVARTAACRAKFSPTLIDGTPVKVLGTITYIFERPPPKTN